MELDVQARAKINLALDVLTEREDGYHDIDTIMQELDLYDTITIESGRGGFVLTCDNPDLALDESNLVFKAWDLLRGRVQNSSVNIHIKKNIPIAAGLAGGSSDAAATLVGLNRFWNLELNPKQLEEIASEIGSDCAFFINGRTQRATGRGEILQPISSYHAKHVVLVNVGKPISSRYVYEHVQLNGEMKIDELVTYLQADSPKAYGLMENQLETVSFEAMPELKDIKEKLLQMGANAALMSGSGPSVFGIFESEEIAKQAHRELEDKYPYVFLTITI